MQRQFVYSMSGHAVPLLDPRSYKSYTFATPPRTHWRRATCEEYECAGWRFGFVLTVNLATELGQRQYEFVTHDKKRSYTMQRVSMDLVKFFFKPGTICWDWDQHKVPVDRPPRLLVAGGDWRGNPTGFVRRHTRVEDWVEDFGEHQLRLVDLGKQIY